MMERTAARNTPSFYCLPIVSQDILLSGDRNAGAAAYDDGGYMVDAFNKSATDCGMLARILLAITDELWKRGYSDEDLAKIYGGNKMRVYQQVWEGVSSEQHAEDYEDRAKLRDVLRKRFMSK